MTLSMEVRFSTCGVTSHIDIRAGFVGWSTEGDVRDQYGTFNGMPVYYYGCDLYDSEDSDWDDPYALASAAYVEDYNFDVPEGMDLMVHRHSRIPDSFGVQQDCQIDVAPVYQTVSYTTKDEWDTSDNDSLTATADEDDPNMDDFYQRVVSSDDENYFDSDDGSATDFDSSMSEGEYYVVLDDGSMADLDGDVSQEVDCGDSDDRDMLEYEDYGDSDVWSVTDLDGYRSYVDEEDCCDSDDRDMLEDIVDSDVWSFTDLDSYRLDVDEEDGCDSDVADLECLNYLGRNCIMDFSAGWTLFPSESGLTGPDGPYIGQIGTLSQSTSSYRWTLAGGCRHPTSPGAAPGYACWPLLVAGGGHCLCPNLTLLARMTCMLLVVPSANLGRCPVDLCVDDTGGPWRDVAVIRPRRDAAPGYPCWHVGDIVLI